MNALNGLRSAVRGQVWLPGEPGFDAARRPWNLAVEQPAHAVVEAVDAGDVAALTDPARAEAVTAKQRALAGALPTSGRKPFTFLNPSETIADAFTPDVVARLRDIKRRHDPHDIFRANNCGSALHSTEDAGAIFFGYSSMVMACAGHTAAAWRTSASRCAGGPASSSTTMPSSSRWSNTSPAVSTHCPEPMHLSCAAVTLIAVPS